MAYETILVEVKGKVGIIAGCMVTSGVVKRGAEARLVRDGVVDGYRRTCGGRNEHQAEGG